MHKTVIIDKKNEAKKQRLCTLEPISFCLLEMAHKNEPNKNV